MRRTPYKSEPGSKFLFFGLGFQRALKKFSIAGFLRVTDLNFQPKYFFPKLFQRLKRCLQHLPPKPFYSRRAFQVLCFYYSILVEDHQQRLQPPGSTSVLYLPSWPSTGIKFSSSLLHEVFGFLLPQLAKMEHPIVVLSRHCCRGVKIHTSTSAIHEKSNTRTRSLKATGPQQSLFSVLSTNVFTCLLRDTARRLVARSYHVRIVF